jgi:uncharacterized membrane protein
VSWRALGTIDTITLSYIVTGSISSSLKIGFTEVLTKIVLYYLHERVWDTVPFGRIHGHGPTHARSLVKGVSWRTVGTLDTMFVAYLITGVPIAALTIGGFEVFTKIALFYVHERIWGKVWWGRISDHRDPVPASKVAEVKVETPRDEVMRPRKSEAVRI